MKINKGKIPQDISEEEIPQIIERASELQGQELYSEQKQPITSRYIQSIANEIGIDEQYINQAIEEILYDKATAEKKVNSPQKTESKTHPSNDREYVKGKKMSNKNLLISIVVLLICILGVFLFRNETPQYQISGSNSTLIVQGNNSTVSQEQEQEPLQANTETSKKSPETVLQQQKKAMLQHQIELLQQQQNEVLNQREQILEEKRKLLEERAKLLNKKERVQKNTEVIIVTPSPSESNVRIVTEQKPKEQETKEKILPQTVLNRKINLEGTWELVAYHLYDKESNDFMEVAVVKNKIEVRENWNFGSGRFRHIMDESLSFSGKFEILDLGSWSSPKNIDLIPGSDFIIHGYKIMANAGFQIPHHYYYVEFDGDHLILYDIGRKLESKQPTQGHEFVKTK
jgi:hypothetical protein